MRDVNAVGGGWTNQLGLGLGPPRPAAVDGRHRRVALQLDRGPHRPEDGRALRHRERHPGPPDDDRLLLALRRQAHSFHGLPQGLRALGDREERPGAGPRPPQVQGRALDGARLHRRRQLRLRLPRLRRDAGSCSRPSSSTSPAWASRSSYLSPKGIKGMAGRVAYLRPLRPVHHGPGRGPERSSCPRRWPSASATPPTTPGRTRS
ncbi:MAG: hypothetical protein M0C28_48080 [Candidatus Moduliflexus flocculans]|nr:hypothetical protein [Candidatus Moduliflexus flocculans]